MMASSSKPRTDLVYYFVLPLLGLACFGLVLGLTYAPCYSAMCVEDYFPVQVRGHIGLFYGLLVGVGLVLWARRQWAPVRNLLEYHPKVLDNAMLVTGKRISMGALLLTIWIAGLSFGSIGFWYSAQNTYWIARGRLADWTPYMFRVIWTGVTGHWIDIWIGLVVIPVGRNSLLSRAFQLHSTTLLFAHKLLAYSLTAGALVHGFLYYSFLGAWVSATKTSEMVVHEFNPDNPALTWKEAEDRGIYSWFVLPTGAVAGIVVIPIMAFTSLPVLRRINYNTFYFLHVVLAALTMVLVCIHASTSFYCLLPGLLLWVGDWAWRVRNALGTTTSVQVEYAKNGWYRVRLPPATSSHAKGGESGNSPGLPDQPLISYYLNIPQIAKLQLHPFTVAEHSESGPVVLFQRGPEKKKAKKRDNEWTWKLAALADNWDIEKPLFLDARIEGPYIEHTPQYHAADHVLAVVGGTGITGALSLANLWIADNASDPKKSFRLVWTVRDQETSQLQEFEQLQAAVKELPNAHLVVHVSCWAGRIDPDVVLTTFLSTRGGKDAKAWIYASGPAGLLAATEAACIQQKRGLRSSGSGDIIADLNWHIASYEV